MTLFDVRRATHPQHDAWRLVLGSGPRSVSPGRLQDFSSRMTVVPERPIGDFLNWVQTFVDDQDRVNNTRSVQVRKASTQSCYPYINANNGSRTRTTLHDSPGPTFLNRVVLTRHSLRKTTPISTTLAHSSMRPVVNRHKCHRSNSNI